MQYSSASFFSHMSKYSPLYLVLSLSISFCHMEVQKTHTGIKKWMVSYDSFAHFPFKIQEQCS